MIKRKVKQESEADYLARQKCFLPLVGSNEEIIAECDKLASTINYMTSVSKKEAERLQEISKRSQQNNS